MTLVSRAIKVSVCSSWQRRVRRMYSVLVATANGTDCRLVAIANSKIEDFRYPYEADTHADDAVWTTGGLLLDSRARPQSTPSWWAGG